MQRLVENFHLCANWILTLTLTHQHISPLIFLSLAPPSADALRVVSIRPQPDTTGGPLRPAFAKCRTVWQWQFGLSWLAQPFIIHLHVAAWRESCQYANSEDVTKNINVDVWHLKCWQLTSNLSLYTRPWLHVWRWAGECRCSTQRQAGKPSSYQTGDQHIKECLHSAGGA